MELAIISVSTVSVQVGLCVFCYLKKTVIEQSSFANAITGAVPGRSTLDNVIKA